MLQISFEKSQTIGIGNAALKHIYLYQVLQTQPCGQMVKLFRSLVIDKEKPPFLLLPHNQNVAETQIAVKNTFGMYLACYPAKSLDQSTFVNRSIPAGVLTNISEKLLH